MANQIHATAMIGPEVKLGDGLVIGPYAVIDGEVSIGDRTEVGAHATIAGPTKMGCGNRVFPHASIGTDPQDKKYQRGQRTFLEVGDNNIFREFVTVNRGTLEGATVTRIGSGNLFMAYAHVAHDCVIGNDCVFANLATLAGHVIIEDRVIVGGITGVHQFVRIGKMAMVGGCTKITQDVAPFALCDGNPTELYGVNLVGLKRANFTPATVKALKESFRILFFSGLARSTAVDRVEKEVELLPEVQHLLGFVKASERGLLKGSSSTAAVAE
jgi:UDP-N-acetylglucosamine acyltransferase